MSMLYKEQFKSEHNFPDQQACSRVVVIASTPRCGSHMIGHSLFETGAFGYPLEYVNRSNLSEWQRRLKTSGVRDTLRALSRIRTSPNGVFGIKAHWSHLKRLRYLLHLHELCEDVTIVYIKRESTLKQAVSLAYAKQSGQWIASQAQTGIPSYDADLINSCLHSLILQSAKWQYFLSLSDYPWMTVNFESAITNLPDEIRKIASFCRIDIKQSSVPQQAPTIKQSSEEKAQWLDRFKQDANHIPQFDIVDSGAFFNKIFKKISNIGLQWDNLFGTVKR